MPTIAQILATKRILIPERAALALLAIRNTAAGRDWLATRLPSEFAMMPRQVRLYRKGDVDKLRIELEQLARLTPPA